MKNGFVALLAVFTAFVLSTLAQVPQLPTRDTSPRVLDVQGGKIRVVTVATGLFHPWSLAFIDSRTILVAEKNGKLRIIRDGLLSPDPVWTSPTATPTADALHTVCLLY